jgi:hypothetical protein
MLKRKRKKRKKRNTTTRRIELKEGTRLCSRDCRERRVPLFRGLRLL